MYDYIILYTIVKQFTRIAFYHTVLYYITNQIISYHVILCYIIISNNIRLCYMIRYTIRYHMISYCGKLNIESWRDVTDAMWYGVHHVSFPSGWGLNQAPQKKKNNLAQASGDLKGQHLSRRRSTSIIATECDVHIDFSIHSTRM